MSNSCVALGMLKLDKSTRYRSFSTNAMVYCSGTLAEGPQGETGYPTAAITTKVRCDHKKIECESLCVCVCVCVCVLVCTINSYFVGQVRALWLGCRHAPQSLVRLAGGSSVVVVERGVAEEEGAGGGVGDVEQEGAGSSSDAIGRGHVTSLKFSGQNSLILLYRYHCR